MLKVGKQEMIHFKLKEIDQIESWGQEPDRSMHWFGLTDGDLWLTFGHETIFEYTREALEYFETKNSPYNDYQLARFVEDLSGIFAAIREPVSETLYELTADLHTFHDDIRSWMALHDSDNVNFDEFIDEKYESMISWINGRTLYSRHLTGGPLLSFFRHENKIRIVWETEQVLINGKRLWTANNGSAEWDYPEFIAKIREFGNTFFTAMDQQTLAANEKDWGNVSLDKNRMLYEQTEREAQFFKDLLLLEEVPASATDWTKTEVLVHLMQHELKSQI